MNLLKRADFPSSIKTFKLELIQDSMPNAHARVGLSDELKIFSFRFSLVHIWYEQKKDLMRE
jgi:hypothetical protein